MANRLSTFNFKPPKAFLSALVLIAVIETGCYWAPLGLPWREILPHTQSGASALRFMAKTEIGREWTEKILIMGASQAKEDLDAGLMEKVLNQNGYPDLHVQNLAVGGGGWPELYMQLDRIGRPKILVVGLSWYGFFMGPSFQGMKNYPASWERLMAFGKLYGRSFLSDAEPLILFAALREFLPSLRYFHVFTESPGSFEAVFGRWLSPEKIYGDSTYSMTMPRRYFLGMLRKGWGQERDFKPERYQKLNERISEAFIREVLSRGTRLVVLDLPLHPAQAVLEGSKYRYREIYRKFMKSLSERYGFRYESFEAFSFVPEPAFADFMHMNPEGRRLLTIHVMEKLIFPMMIEMKNSRET